MEKSNNIYLSNDLEVLAAELKKNLFSATSAFALRYLIVPSPMMKEWLAWNFANDPLINICMGVKFLYFEEGLSTLISHFFEKKPSQRIKELELLLHLEQESGKPLSYCKNLATLFKRYGIYSRGKLENRSPQTHLYEKIFSSYTTDYEYFTHLEEKENPHLNLSIHFFGFHHISRLHTEFLLKLPHLSFYTLSPCQEFWSDFLTDKEIKKFFSKKKMAPELRVEWESYLDDRHPLLANLGRVGRKWALFMEEEELPTFEKYLPSTSSSLLGKLQNSLLELKEEKLSYQKGDESLQVHLFTSRHREVQGLLHYLTYLIAEKKIAPLEITVFAPDISLYTPYIQTYFTKIPYRITDSLSPFKELQEGFNLLFGLEKNRWSPEAVCRLIFHPLFKKRLTHEDRELFKKWLEDEVIHFGFDLHHANTLLKKSHCHHPLLEESKTWKAAFERLFLGFASSPDNFTNSFKFVPEIIKSDLFAQIAYLLQSLYYDLAILYDETSLPLSTWVDYLTCLYEAYFVQSEEIEKLEEFKVNSGSMKERCYTFSTLQPFFEDFLSKSPASLSREEYNQVTFSTLLPGRITPSKVLVILGMNQEEFPRKESFAPLDQLALQKEKDYYPTSQERDRYLFLETLLMAREYFMVSYLGKSAADQSELLPSSVLSELLFTLPKEIVVSHPNLSFDPLYFEKSQPLLKNYSTSDFHTCELFFQTKKPSYFIPEFYDSKSKNIPPSLPEGRVLIDIADLRKLLRYPIKFFLEKKLSLTIKNSDSSEEFSLSALDRYHFRHLALQTPLESLVQHFEKEGKLPPGGFKEVSLLRLRKENREREKSLLHLGIQAKELSSQNISFEFAYDSKRVFHLVGKIPQATREGLLVFDKCQLSSAIRLWSDLLLLNATSTTPQSLFFENEIVKAPFFSDPNPYLRKLIDYYFQARETPIPLLPEWIEPLLIQNVEKLEQKILATSETSWDESLHYAFRNSPPKALKLIEEWSPLAHTLFQEIQDGWF